MCFGLGRKLRPALLLLFQIIATLPYHCTTGTHFEFHHNLLIAISHSCRLSFKDQYIELSTELPRDADVYGLGEATLATGLLLPRNGKILTLWARDIGADTVDANLYGSHPFYLQVNPGNESAAHHLVMTLSQTQLHRWL